MRSKKASWTGFVLHPVFELFIAVFVLLAMLWFIHGLDEKTVFEKRFLANDIALIMDAIPAMPQHGNLWLLYTPPQHKKFNAKYGYSIAKDSAPVVDVVTKPDDSQPGRAYFTPDPAVRAEPSELLFKGAMIVPYFLKQGNRLWVENMNDRKTRPLRTLLACDGPQFTGKIAAVSVHASGNETAAEQAMASIVQGQLLSQTGPESALALKIGGTPADTVLIKAYVNGENAPELLAQSQRLGCEIADAVLLQWESQGIDVAGLAVIPINPEQTGTQDDDVLQKGKTGVLLEFGTLKRQGLFDDISQQRAAALAIVGGIKHA